MTAEQSEPMMPPVEPMVSAYDMPAASAPNLTLRSGNVALMSEFVKP